MNAWRIAAPRSIGADGLIGTHHRDSGITSEPCRPLGTLLGLGSISGGQVTAGDRKAFELMAGRLGEGVQRR